MPESPKGLRPGGDLPSHGFERDRNAEHEIVGSIDLAHPSLADEALDPIPFGELMSRRKLGTQRSLPGLGP